MLLSSYSLSIESPGNSWYAVNDIIPTLLRILDGKTIYTLYFHPYNLAMLNNEYDIYAELYLNINKSSECLNSKTLFKKITNIHLIKPIYKH